MPNPPEPFTRTNSLAAIPGLTKIEIRDPVEFTSTEDKAAFIAHLGALLASALDTDTTLGANSDTRIATQKAVRAHVAAAVAALVNSAPSTLDTLSEISAALGNDGNLSATLTALIGTKAPLLNPVFSEGATAITFVIAGNNNGPLLYSGVTIGHRDSNTITTQLYGFDNKFQIFLGGAARLTVSTAGAVAIPGTLSVGGNAVLTTGSTLADGQIASAAAWNAKVSATRTISAGGLATGGGDLSANRTITVPKANQAQAEAGEVDNVAMTPLTTKQAIEALAAGGGGAISLGALTAFLRPGGNDTTGTPGDPAKPYATAAAALADGARVLILAARTSGDYGAISLSDNVCLIGYGAARSVLGAVTLNGHKLTGNGEQLVSVGAVSGGGAIEDLTAASIAAHGEEALAPGTPGTSGASVSVIRSRVTGNAELYGGNGGSDSYISGSPTQFTVECAPGNHTATLTLDGVPYSVEVIDGYAVFPDISGWARSSFGSSSPLISENYTSVTYADYSVGASGGLNIVGYTPGSPDVPTAGGDGGNGGTLTLTRSTVEGAILLARGLAGSGGTDGADGTLHAAFSVYPSPTGSFDSGQLAANIVDGVFVP